MEKEFNKKSIYALISFSISQNMNTSPILCVELSRSSRKVLNFAPVNIGYPKPVDAVNGLAKNKERIFAAFTVGEKSFALALNSLDLSPVFWQELPEIINPHSILVNEEFLYIVSTGTDEIWRYQILSNALGQPERVWQANTTQTDTHHINSIAEYKGNVYIAAFGLRTGESWKTAENGYIYNITCNEYVYKGIPNPQALSIYNGRLYYSLAYTKQFCFLEENLFQFDFFPGKYDWIFEGTILVAVANRRTATGLEQNQVILENGIEYCGLEVRNMSGEVIQEIDLAQYGTKIHDVIVLSEDYDLLEIYSRTYFAACKNSRDNYKTLKTMESEMSQQLEKLRRTETLFKLTKSHSLDYKRQLDEITRSKIWKFALKLRQIRLILIPERSKRFYFLQKIFLFYKNIRNRFSKQNWGRLRVNPLISVIIPIYDRTNLLIESIESILCQSYKHFELLLICDGSPKDTLDIVDAYEAKYSNIRVYKFKINSGNAVKGRNKGIKEARGKYLAFHDSDDVADPDRLKTSLRAIVKNKVDIVYGGWRAIVDGTRDVGLANGQEIFSPDCDLDMLLDVCVPCQSTVMAKTDVLRAVGGLNPKMCYREDHELWARLAYNGYKFKSINRVLTNLRLHQNNLEISYKQTDDYWKKLFLSEYKRNIKMKPKIGYVIPGTGISGGIAVICEHANRLIERGYDVSLVSEDNTDEIAWFPNLLADVVPLDKADQNYDILVATGWSTAYTVQKLPVSRRVYLVQSDESRFFPEDDKNVSLALQTYEMDFEFVTVARWLQNWLKNTFNKDSIYVPNGINENIFYQVKPLVDKGKRMRVLIEGPINIPFKGVKDAFAVVAGLNCEVWCVSSLGEPDPEWQCDRFFYQVPFNEMKDIYSSCDVLLKMSRVESFCLPPLEMMACGGTAVIGEVTGIDEYAVNKYNSIIVEQGDIQGAREALIQLIDDKELREQLAANGKITAEKFRWDKTIDLLENVFYDKTN